MNLLPLLSNEIFFVFMVVLQLVDGWTTYTAYKLTLNSRRYKFRELNPVLRKLMEIFGVKEALWIVLLWFYPMQDSIGQWILIAMYVFIVLSNYRQIKIIKK